MAEVKIELGGGGFAHGNGYLNVDMDARADIQHDLNQAWPFGDDSVDAFYSSHCLEHLDCPHHAFREMARCGKLGTRCVIKVPHPWSHMAMVAGHKHVVSPLMVENMDVHFPHLHWTGDKRLRLVDQIYNATTWLEDAKRELPWIQQLDDQTIMKWIPGTAHETVFTFEVQKNG